MNDNINSIEEKGAIDIKHKEEIEDEMTTKKDVHPIIETTAAVKVHHNEPEILKKRQASMLKQMILKIMLSQSTKRS